ncbi:MAG: TCP-1/cpn60 chaperonin family protein [Candidatus Thalassarchaeaceae archaeon]|nr:TCP-1/cpn60 chaperonin family protein [Candidatus Thalassarchaeaceae archaeon]
MAEGTQGHVPIVRQETRVTSGVEVTQKLIHAAKTLSSILRGTLGPRGLDKGLYKTNGEFAVTSDGARVLNDLLIKNPGAKLLVSLGQAQESAIGDGVTSTVLLAGALLDEAGRLIRKGVHPLTVVDGYLMAAEIAVSALEEDVIECSEDDNDLLLKVASTSMTGRAAGSDIRFAKMLVEALAHVTHDTESGIRCEAEDVLFEKLEDSTINDTRMVTGVFWRQRIPMERMVGVKENAKVALLNCDIKQRETKRDTEIELQSAEDLQKFMAIHEQTLAEIADNIIATDAEIICSSGDIDRIILHRLAAAGKVVIHDVDQKQLVHLAQASGAKLVEHLDDFSNGNLGLVGRFEAERRLATDEVQDRIIFDGCTGPLVTILVGGAMGSEETIRGMYDALRATSLARSEGTLLPGGGASHMLASKAVKEAAENIADRSRLGMDAFGRALEMIPWMLAANSGVNPLDALLELRSAVRENIEAAGVSSDGSITSMSDVLEPAESILHGIMAATETTNTLLRCDQVISARGD